MRIFWLCLLLLAPAWARPVVLVSIDGCRPEFYTSDSFDTPTLHRLASEGRSAEKMLSVFPTLTYPNHTSMMTGVPSAVHGIETNLVNLMKPGRFYNWEAGRVKVRTVYGVAYDAGLRTALLAWPVTVGARATILAPEIFHVPGYVEASTAELLTRYSTPGLLERFGVEMPNDFPGWDEQLTRVVVKLLADHEVDFLAVHIIEVDEAQHHHGPDSPEAAEAIANVDRLIARMVEADPEATFVIAGDHGFRSYHTLVYPNQMLKKAGIEDAYVHASGGSGAVYTERTDLEELFTEQAQGRYRILSRADLDQLQAFPGAAFGLLASDGVAFSSNFEDDKTVDPPRGQHGYLPEDVPTGLILWGKDIPPGQLGTVDILDVAPTLAHLLG
ncbi:MAG: alkaline phosphatase family protein, partial [Candidatus Eremiobacteraeota bacterium]|nr:alkaline phosphatase family protein [Candidatus Eremiobacteraeota bacterium]